MVNQPQAANSPLCPVQAPSVGVTETPDPTWPPPDGLHQMAPIVTALLNSSTTIPLAPAFLDSMHMVPPALDSFGKANNWSRSLCPSFKTYNASLFRDHYGPVAQVIASPELGNLTTASQFESGFVFSAIVYVWGPTPDASTSTYYGCTFSPD